jgi:hypothetical protein
VSAARKAALLGRAVVAALAPASPDPAPAGSEAHDLVEAAAVAGPVRPAGMADRVIWMLELFNRLEQRDAARQAAAAGGMALG